MCLLTERPKGCSEAERRIVGAFMVEDDFIGTCCTDGTIQAHPTHRIQLPPERQPLFWPYVAKEPEKQRWGKRPSNICPTAPMKRSSLIARRTP